MQNFYESDLTLYVCTCAWTISLHFSFYFIFKYFRIHVRLINVISENSELYKFIQ